MEEATWSIRQIFLDTIILSAVGIPTPVIKSTNIIHRRGFFCNDETIMYPLKESSIHNDFFHPLVCLFCVATIITIEFLYFNSKEKIPLWKYFNRAYQVLVSFAFGVLTTILIGTAIKGFIGRLRPHFFAACAPSINCTLPENHNIYHIDYECHTSFSTFCAVFVAILVHKRITWGTSSLFKVAIESFIMVLPLYVATSCISDYKHHPEDVLAGAVIGAAVAAVAALASVNLYDKTQRKI